MKEKHVKDNKKEKMSRPLFLKYLGLGWLAVVMGIGGFVTALLRYLFPRVLFEPPQVFKAGYPSEYRQGEVSARFKEKYGIFVVRSEEGFYALSAVCTHLGCAPSWSSGDNKFKCPCHGSGFRKSGINFEGPAPRPLERYKIFLDASGQIVVDKTVRFQQEKGQWGQPFSLLVV